MNFDLEDMIRNKKMKNERNLFLDVIAYERRADLEITKSNKDYSPYLN
jgi:hypothetical protein